MRYRHLLNKVAELKPRRILEVGTWNGERAKNFLTLSPGAKYFGFDLFEDATADTDRRELNVKKHHSLKSVQKLLAAYDVELFKGDTRKTLAEFNETVDFVWLDGGHSVETIRSDWENVKRCLEPGATVFFDDYYSGGIDTSKYGCNEVVKGLQHEVLPEKDIVRPEGFVQIVRVYP